MNVTPLVDVVLVLLIIFMVVTPALNDGEHVEVPALKSPDPKPKDLHPIDVVLAQSGRASVDKKEIPAADLEKSVRSLHEADPERLVVIKADSRLEYGKVRSAFGKLQALGLKGLSLKVTEKKKAGAG